MTRARVIIARLLGLARGRSRDDDLRAEIQGHLDALTADYRRAGLPEDQARAAARRAFGGVSQTIEAHRDLRRWWFADEIGRDIRQAIRGLIRRPAFAVVTVLTLAVGTAASAVVFGLVNAVLLRPLPVQHADRLVVVARERPDGTTLTAFTPGEIDQLRSLVSVWPSIIATSPATLTLQAAGQDDRVLISFVSENYWQALGLAPSAGTLFRQDGGLAPGAAGPVLVLSYDYWQRRFGGRPDVLGRPVTLGGSPLTIVGVAPRGFHGDSLFTNVNAFVPMHAPGFTAGRRPARVLGILAGDLTLAQANAALAPLAGTRARNRGEAPDRERLVAVWERLARPTPHTARPEILSAVFFGLLSALGLALAGVNAGHLVVMRTAGRSGELAIRAALGASRARLALHLFVEVVLIAAVASLLGLLVGAALMVALGRLLPPALAPVAFQAGTGFDWRAALFLGGILAATAVVAGVAPALRAARPPLDALRETSGTATARRMRMRRALMVLQVAASVMLLIVAGLLARSLQGTRAQSFGFDRRGVYDFRLNPAEMGVMGGAAHDMLRSVRTRVAALPGVRSAALTQCVPMTSSSSAARIYPDVPPTVRADDDVGYCAISPEYFDTLHVPLVEGRPLSALDTARSPRVVIVSAAMARRFWPQGGAVGRHFRVGSAAAPPVEIVGVAADILNYSALQDAALPFFYLPLDQHPTPAVTLLVRSDAAAGVVFGTVNAAIASAAPGLVPFEVQTMNDTLDAAIDGLLLPRLGSWFGALFALLGLVLAVVGLYGVVSFGVGQRTRELALRVALGAAPGRIRADVLRQATAMVAGGIVLGVAVAAGFSLLTANLYFGVSPLDPLTFVVSTLVVAVTALAACDVPARRAMRADPLSALKAE
jgi:predicted permease